MKKTPFLLLSGLAGAVLLFSLSALQKFILGAPFSSKGFLIPILFGAGAGILASWLYYRLRHQFQELRRQRDLLRAIFSSTPDIMVLKDRESVYLHANEAFCRFIGRASGEIIGKSDFDLFPAAEAGIYREDDARVMASRTPLLKDEEVTAPDGKHWMQVAKSPVFDASGDVTGLLISVRDITTRKRAEEALSRTHGELERLVEERTRDLLAKERELSAIIENLPHMLFVKDAEELRFVRFNRAGEALLGMSREELIGHNDYDFFPREQADFFIAKDREVLLSGKQMDIQEEPIETPWGTRILHTRKVCLHDAEGRPAFLLGISEDVTERKQAEAALLESIQRYQSVLASTKDGFWMVDTEGRLLEVNDSYCRLSGYSRDELLDMRITDLDDSSSPEEVKERIGDIIEKGNLLFETTHRRKDGGSWPVEISVSYSPFQGGRFFSFLRDIRERKQEELLGELRQQLAERVYKGDQRELLQVALDMAERLTHSEIGFFHYVEKDQETLSLQTWSTRTLEEMCFAEGDGLHYPISQAGVWVDCIHRRAPVIHNDYPALYHKKGLPEGHAPLLRELTVPVIRDNLIVAVMGVGNKAEEYDLLDESVAVRIADMAFDFVGRKQAEQQIQFMAYNDVLTGLPNRQLFADRLQQATALTRRSGRLLAVCYLDLDGFKPVNDRYGHAAGDRLLVQLSNRLVSELRKGDTLARLGGDEFVILLRELGTIFHGEEIVQRILDTVAQPFEIEGQRVHISASIGVTLFPQDDEDPDTLLRHADQAMYKAKAGGKNTYSLYDPIQDQKVHAHRRALNEFEQALLDRELVLHFQPRVRLSTGELASVEALVRWQHPQKGLLPPGHFLPLIEETPLEIALDEWVMRAALEQHMRWRDQGLVVPVSVNVTPRHIQQSSFPQFLEELLTGYSVDIAEQFELEVLETSAIGDTTQVAEVMNACAQLGVRFSLDDFGTGYSSLTYFHRLPISVLKIDQHFVRDMLDDPRDQDIVEGVLRLADALNRPVVAEGVESIEVGVMLLQLGCEYAQGYGIARPMPAEAFVEWTAGWREDDFWHQLGKETGGTKERYDLNVAIFTYRRWQERVGRYLQTLSAAECPVLDQNQCQFNRWYKGIGRIRYGNQPGYAFILAKHNEIHELAKSLEALAQNGDRGGAVAGLDELHARGEELISMLKRLHTQ